MSQPTAVPTPQDTTPLENIMHPSWAHAMAPIAEQIHAMGDFITAQHAAGIRLAPDPARILRAFSRPIEDVRVLILGQDPYPTPGHAVGLSFSVDRDVRPVPKSLQNIYTELETDLGVGRAEHGDLTAWADQGVLLINKVLTTAEGATAAHRGKGWEAITTHAIEVLMLRHALLEQPLVAVLWGRDAQSMQETLTAGNIPVVASPHPSPLSARRGFFGSRPFSTVNQHLQAQGATPIDWRVE